MPPISFVKSSRIYRSILLIAFSVSGFGFSVFAQTLQISAHDSGSKLPIVGATILILNQNGQIQAGTSTNADGQASFAKLSPAMYQVVVSFVGYASWQQSVDLFKDMRLDVALSIQALPQNEVIVTAQRGQSQLDAMTISNMTHRDFESRPAMKDLPVLFSETPSVTYYSENGNGVGYSYLRMRGFDQRRIAVSVNGIPQNDAEDHNVYWINFFDLQGAISDVQIQRGASASFYGSAGIGGAVNIVALPYQPQKYAEVQTGYGSFGTKRLSVEVNSGAISAKKGGNNGVGNGAKTIIFARLSRLESDGYRENSWAKFSRFFVGATHYTNRSTLTLQAFGGPQTDGLAYYGIAKADNADLEKRRANYSATAKENEWFHQPHIEFLHELKVNESKTFSQKLYALRGTGYFDFDATYRSANYLRLPSSFQHLTQAQRDLPLYESSPTTTLLQRATVENTDIGWLPSLTIKHGNSETTLGTETRFHRSLHWGRIQDASADVPSSVVGDADARFYMYKGEKLVGALYGKHLVHPSSQLTLQADAQLAYMRYRLFDEKYFNTAFSMPYLFFNPRIGATYNPTKTLSFYASLALAGREPRLKELYDGEEAGAGSLPQFTFVSGKPDFSQPIVKPEHLLNLELGTSIRKTHYRWAANMYWMEFKNEIVPSGGLDQFGVARNGNADRSRHFGLETEGAVLLAKGFNLSGNATWGSHRLVKFTEYTDGTPFVRDGNPIAGFPAFIANLKASYHVGSLSLNLIAQHNGKQFVDNSGGIEADGTQGSDLVNDAFTLVNASLLYEPTKQFRGLQIGLDVNNVLDSKILMFGNADRVFFPLATRNMFVSAKYSF
jgi:iron complex outermembrane receptor protein